MARVNYEEIGLSANRLPGIQPMAGTHAHQEVELNFVFAGAVTYLHRGELRRLPAGRLSVFWGAVPHSLVAVEPGSELGWITVPLAWVRGWELDARFLARLIEGEWVLAPEGFAARFPVGGWVEELSAGGAEELRGLLHELQGCLQWLARRSVRERAEGLAVGGAGEGWGPVEVMARVMAEGYLEPLTVAQVAAAARLHPNYAMTLFHRRCGITLRDYITQLRVTHAQRLLLDGDAKVADVAMESGFNTLSAFYEAFVRGVALTPRAYRARHRAGADIPARVPSGVKTEE